MSEAERALARRSPAEPAVAGGSGAGTRRRRLVLALCCLLVAVVGLGSYVVDQRRAVVPLYAGTVAVGAGGIAVEVPDEPDLLLPGTRVLRSAPDAARLAAEQRRWLAAGSVPSVPELGNTTLLRDALLDLRVLASEHGVAVAGWSQPWHYVWPRDAALVAAALARTGHNDDAEQVISFLQRVQPQSGHFHARYLPDGSGIPDSRGVQLDGLGWALWGMREVAGRLPASDRGTFVRRHWQLLDRSSKAIPSVLDPRTGLPPASPDYWEVAEDEPTLATAAVLHAGLRSAATLYRYLAADTAATTAAQAADELAESIEVTFAADGYPRTAGGPADSADLGVAFLLPPFVDRGARFDRAVQVWLDSAGPMARQAGGLAPGGSWRDDGVSWTTATSSRAMTAASLGRRDEAVAWLRWLDEHRTRQGSIPEKVLYDGKPASVAPLAWAAAAVLIGASEISG
ncbi:MAG TPA: glycoside hydrolase family 15 protein [Propionibacteriaceae bacterium]|nr:glycoside hydrolase family 15 protein [Propionibacteriaceae bacterium]